jgi:hypothetical protein
MSWLGRVRYVIADVVPWFPFGFVEYNLYTLQFCWRWGEHDDGPVFATETFVKSKKLYLYLYALARLIYWLIAVYAYYWVPVHMTLSTFWYCHKKDWNILSCFIHQKKKNCLVFPNSVFSVWATLLSTCSKCIQASWVLVYTVYL